VIKILNLKVIENT